MGDHARLAPSAWARWSTCPGSVSLIEQHKDRLYRPESPLSAGHRGTVIHKVSEVCLSQERAPMEYVGRSISNYTLTQEDCAMATQYVDAIREIDKEMRVSMYEERVNISPECWGTADYIGIKDRTLLIADLKTGVIPVDPNSGQLKLYSLGGFLEHDWLYEFDTIVNGIFQPAVSDRLQTVKLKRDDIMRFHDEALEAIERVNTQSGLLQPSDAACRWCPAINICPMHIDAANKAAATDFASVPHQTDDELSTWLDVLPLLKRFISAIEDESLYRLSQGRMIKGYKLGTGRRTREWANAERVSEWLSTRGIEPDLLYESIMLSPAKLEKRLKSHGITSSDINELIQYKEGNPKLIRDTSSDDFSDV